MWKFGRKAKRECLLQRSVVEQKPVLRSAQSALDMRQPASLLGLTVLAVEKNQDTHLIYHWCLPEDEKELPSVGLQLSPMTKKCCLYVFELWLDTFHA